MSRLGAVPVVLLAATVLLTGCDGPGEVTTACRVDVDTAELRQARADAGIADCEPGEGNADLPDVALPCLGSERTASLAAVAGPAMINFWASNCGPCRTEMPVLQAFHEQYGDRVAVIGVDYLESYPEAAIELAERSGVTYPSLADACGELQQTELVISGLPQFVFVKADGSIVRTAGTGGVDSVSELVDLAEENLGLDLKAGKR